MTATAVAVLLGCATTAPAQTPKSGGVLNVKRHEELPQGLSIHETSTIATVWPASPFFNIHEIQKKLTLAGARPTVSRGIDHFAHWPHVTNLVPHHSLDSFGRMQEVGLDR
jgi:hypothetical protein